MRKLLSRSFRGRLFGAFLVVSLIPLLICSMMLLQIFRLRLTDTARSETKDHLSNVLHTMDTLYDGFFSVDTALQGNPLVAEALLGNDGEDTQVYSQLFSATEGLRSYAQFDLYDLKGNWRYSTQSVSVQRQLPTNWGVLQRAAQEKTLTFVKSDDITATDEPLLQGAVLLTGTESDPVGYLVISMYHANLRQLLEGTYGTQNNLILLSRYWRPIYCAQPSLAVSIAPELRARLLAGESLDGVSGDFLYSVEYHQPTGMYLVLRRPQVFTQDTMGLLYTVSLSSALVCIAVSVLMSLKLSQQMFRPIERLHTAIEEVGHNNLDVYVAPTQDDELGELARRFNGMVVALKHNQEELVENQRELNKAQIRMLQAQLNPHFLCNTLDTMKWISKINQMPQVALMSTSLADILRFCISPDEFVPLRREVETLERYIEIQKIRLSSSFSFEVELPMELEDCLVPKMVLQPIVENAILHGLEGMEQGKIRVEAKRAETGLLQIVVADNGCGIPQEMTGPYSGQSREKARGHLGLYNVDTILLKHYGEGFGLFLENRSDETGAMVTATLPIRNEEDNVC
ncbi:putative two-component sensor kinase YesM [uncultured Eubacteriales bacterium]|uniref:Putative two-component sensor kinase YesM n=1 Tax=uncultured Eubacteriales bacterium TaxID=172733 RepID=A0A212KGC2_9FIRM|nr:putative two-component sensor kinase YesM [uncultured Eubacteriales bacterium]